MTLYSRVRSSLVEDGAEGSEEWVWFWAPSVCGTPVGYAQRTLGNTPPL